MNTDAEAAHEALIQFLYQAPMGLVQTTPDGDITMANPMSVQLLMPLAADGNLTNLFDVLSAVAPDLRSLAAERRRTGDVVCDALRVVVGSADGSDPAGRTLEIGLRRLDAVTLMGSITDVTLAVEHERRRLVSRLRDVSRIDSLTALPNRSAVLECVERILARRRAGDGRAFAVLCVNCDRFNRVNDTLGTAAGDELLRQMAARLTDSAQAAGAPATGDDGGRAPHLTGRLGGDEFVVVIDGLSGRDALRQHTGALLDLLSRPYRVAGQPVHVQVSIGAVGDAEAADDGETVLRDASIAMREAKRAGGGRDCRFEPAMRERAARRGLIERELRLALTRRELFVVYQPIVDLGDGACTGLEALVRWSHPTRGTVPPIEFIEIAEETGLIGPLGDFVLNEACRQFVAWQHLLGDDAPRTLSVNLSRAQIVEPSLVGSVRDALQRSGLAARHLQLEVTETLAAQGPQIQARLHELKALGVTLALDDFGTGYSSLACLHLLPVDVVKIDRSFVIQSEVSAHHRVLIEATVRVARSLGMRTVAEGIETAGQADVLRTLKCDKGQGYLFSRPLSAEAAGPWLQARGRDAQPAVVSPAGAARDPTAQLLACLEQSTIAIGLFDPHERLAYANRSYLAMHWGDLDGTPTWEEIMRQAHGRRRGLLIDTVDIDTWLADVRRRYRRQPRRIFESDMVDGRWMRVAEETRDDGWQLCVSSDVTSLKVSEADLRRARDAALVASNTDPLTDLPNRRFVLDRLAEKIVFAKTMRTSLTVAVIDLDEFKRINDVHGHGVGDQVLVSFARRLAAAVRPADAVGRIGGEEFLLVMPDTRRHAAGRLLTVLRAAFAECAVEPALSGVRVGFSAGLAELDPADTLASVCRRADQGQYRAKALGRGRDCFVDVESSAQRALV